jgi:hypothetical protein
VDGTARSQPRGGGVRLTDRDRALLAFAAEHRLVLETQVATLLGTSLGAAAARLRVLAGENYLARRRLFAGQSAYCQIRPRGLAAVASELPPPRLKLADYRHDVGVAWLWLAARAGTFGRSAEVLGERRLRSHDGALSRRERCGRPAEEPYAVYLGGVDRVGNPRLHYPDLLLIDEQGTRIALELELSLKEPARRERILGGYAADGRIDSVLYLVEDDRRGQAIARAIAVSGRRTEMLDRLHIQLITPIDVAEGHRAPGAGRSWERRSEAAL